MVPAPPGQPATRQAFAAGATAAASGAIAGAVVVLGQRAIFDLPTAAMGVIGLALLEVPGPGALLVAAAGLAGLVVCPGPRWMTAAHHTASSAECTAWRSRCPAPADTPPGCARALAAASTNLRDRANAVRSAGLTR